MKEETLNGPHIDVYGVKRWYKNGSIHRDDGPAIIYPSGYMAWYRHNRWHRDDGPARVWPNITPEWYKHGTHYTPTAHEIMTWKMNEKGKEEA